MFFLLIVACMSEAERNFPADSAEALCSKQLECEPSSYPSHEACAEEWTSAFGCVTPFCTFIEDNAQAYLEAVGTMTCDDPFRPGVLEFYEDCDVDKVFECLTDASG